MAFPTRTAAASDDDDDPIAAASREIDGIGPSPAPVPASPTPPAGPRAGDLVNRRQLVDVLARGDGTIADVQAVDGRTVRLRGSDGGGMYFNAVQADGRHSAGQISWHDIAKARVPEGQPQQVVVLAISRS